MELLDEFNKVESLDSMPTNTVYGIEYSHNDEYLAVGHGNSPYVSIYKRSKKSFAKLANPDVLPKGDGRDVSFSPDDNYLAVSHSTSPFITIYKRNDDTFTKLNNPDVLPPSIGYGASFSSDGNYLAVAHATSPFITIYKRNGDTFTKLSDPSVLPAGIGNAVSFSPDGNYLTVGHNTTPFLTIYKRNGDTFTKLADPDVLPPNTVNGLSFSSNNGYLALSHDSSPYVIIYKRNGDSFTKLENPDKLPSSTGMRTDFSPDNNYLAVSHANSPYVTIFKRDGDTFTKIDNPSKLPVGTARGVGFAHRNNNLSVGHINSPYISMYEQGGIYDTRTIFFSDSSYKVYNSQSDSWVTVPSNQLAEQDYLTYGMEDISTIPESAWEELGGNVELCYWTEDKDVEQIQIELESEPFTLEDELEGQTIKIIEYTDNLSVTESSIAIETVEPFTLYDEFGDSVDVLYYTDDTDKTNAELELVANYSPLDEIDEDFEVVTWTNEEPTTAQRVLNMTATPKPQFIRLANPRKLWGYLDQVLATNASIAYRDDVRYLLTDEKAKNWYVWDRFLGKFKIVDASTHEAISKNGMKYTDLQTLTSKNWKTWDKDYVNIGVFLKDDPRDTITSVVDKISYNDFLPKHTTQVKNTSLYILNTTAKITLDIVGNTVKGVLSDDDLTRVQYRVFLNGQVYYPADGGFTKLAEPPANIELTIPSRDLKMGDWNTVKVEFQDFFGSTDYWSNSFIGTYTGLMFKDVYGQYYSSEIGEVLQYLDFGVIIAGQTTIENEIILKNQYGYDVENLHLYANTTDFPQGMKVEFSKTQSPFNAQPNLKLSNVLANNEEMSFFIRLKTELGSTPDANGSFDIIVRADKVDTDN